MAKPTVGVTVRLAWASALQAPTVLAALTLMAMVCTVVRKAALLGSGWYSLSKRAHGRAVNHNGIWEDGGAGSFGLICQRLISRKARLSGHAYIVACAPKLANGLFLATIGPNF